MACSMGANKQMLVSLLGDENQAEDAIDELLRTGRIKENSAIQPGSSLATMPDWYIAIDSECDIKVKGVFTGMDVRKTDNGVQIYSTPRTDSEN